MAVSSTAMTMRRDRCHAVMVVPDTAMAALK
jgi:hypothetical protein